VAYYFIIQPRILFVVRLESLNYGDIGKSSIKRLTIIATPTSPNAKPTDEILNTDQAAKYLSITKSTLYKYTSGKCIHGPALKQKRVSYLFNII
jgi:hypothetical protein